MTRPAPCLAALLAFACAAFGSGAFGCAASALPPEEPREAPLERAPLAPVIVDPLQLAETRVVRVSGIGLAAPESIVHDTETDSYLVSNINGSPFAQDNNGFISSFHPDGRLSKLRLIAGGQNQVTLHAPKGLAIKDRTLYVADLDTVRTFDLTSGAARAAIPVPGATFLNALALAADGTLYVSDSGIKEGFESTGSDAIYRIRGEREVERLASGPSLGHPSGLHAANGGVWAVGFTSGELYFVGADGKQANVRKLPSAQLDGIVELDEAQLAITSWEGRCVYRGPVAGGEFTKLVGDTPSAAGIGYDKKRERLLLPLVLSDALEAHSLPPPAPGP